MVDVCANPNEFDNVGFSASRYENARRFFPGGAEEDPLIESWTDDNYIGWVEGLTSEESAAIEDYAFGDNFNNINTLMREDAWDTLSQEEEATILNLESALDKAVVPEDVIVYRGGSADLQNLEPGSVFVDEAYVSTSFDKGIAQIFGHPVEIIVPKGYNAAALNASGMGQHREYELLLQAGARFKAMGENEDGVKVLMLVG